MAVKLGTLFGGGAKQSTSTGEKTFHLARMDMDAEELEPDWFSVDFLVHWVETSPTDPTKAVLFEKHGPGCCFIDLASGEVLETITTDPQREFYGHGKYSRDGSLVYAVETDLSDNSKGYIRVRDAKDFKQLGDFPSYGLAPHDAWMIDGGKTLVISNGGSKLGEPNGPNVAYIDIDSQKLLERVDIPAEHINAGHLAITSKGDLAVVSAPRAGIENPGEHEGGISLRPKGQPIHTISEPKDTVSQMLGETLSVAVHEPSGAVAATNPEGNIVTFWRLQTGELIKSLRVPNPRGISMALNGDEFILTFGQTGKVSRVDAERLEAVDVPGNRSGYVCGATGSHILMYDLPN